MTTNSYFNHYNASNEHSLIEDLVIESIQTQGLDVAYIPRSQANIDYLYNEDPSNVFTSFTAIEMYPAFVDGFDGDQLMTVFGDEFKKSATFICSKKRFTEELIDLPRPREGDLVFMPVTNTILEIKFVDMESPFFEKGKQYVYEIKLEAFEYSYEDVETGDMDLDSILDELKVPNQQEDTEEYGQNEDIDTDPNVDIDFDPNNPFGVR